MKKKITRIVRKSGDWYIAYIRELPGVNTQGRTLAEARSNLREALALVTEARAELRLGSHRKRSNKAISL
jgi:predicted RNase H-like HicB family nuclease